MCALSASGIASRADIIFTNPQGPPQEVGATKKINQDDLNSLLIILFSPLFHPTSHIPHSHLHKSISTYELRGVDSSCLTIDGRYSGEDEK